MARGPWVLPAPPLGAWLAARAKITQFRFSRRLAGTRLHSIHPSPERHLTSPAGDRDRRHGRLGVISGGHMGQGPSRSPSKTGVSLNVGGVCFQLHAHCRIRTSHLMHGRVSVSTGVFHLHSTKYRKHIATHIDNWQLLGSTRRSFVEDGRRLQRRHIHIRWGRSLAAVLHLQIPLQTAL